MKQLIVVASIITLTTSHSFNMETTTSNTKKADKRYVIFQNLLPTNDPDIPNPRIDIVTKGENVVEFYRDKEYIHNSEAKGVTPLYPGETKKIFLKTKKASDQLGIDEDGHKATLNIYTYAGSELMRVRIIEPENWHVVPAFERCMHLKLINTPLGMSKFPLGTYKGIGLYTDIRFTSAFPPLIKDKLEEK